jgi:hypothetical protein
MIRSDFCQSCGTAPVEITEIFDDPADPYMICSSCRDRLLSHSLRPIEWYNLSALHGRCNDLLGEEYYWEEDGYALQATDRVENSSLFPSPTLEKEKGSPERLLTFILTRNHWHEGFCYINDQWVTAMKSFSPDALLPVFSERLIVIRSNEVIRTILNLAGLVLGKAGASLVRDHWDRYVSTAAFYEIAFAASQCLPTEEGYRNVTDELSKMDARRRYALKDVLRWFETPLTLDWIEENACSPVDVTWGPLAASSKFDWERAKKWLSSGRPLSLIALDALYRCVCSNVLLLLNPPDSREFISTLKDYLNGDNVPRVRERISALLEYAYRL